MQRYRVVGAAPAAVLGRIAGLAARSLGAPMAMVVIVDQDGPSLAATHGFDAPPHAISRDDPTLGSVPDAVTVIDGAVTGGSGFLHDHAIQFYAAAPILTFDGYRLGVVAVMDTEVRPVIADHLVILEDLAAIVMEQLELRLSALDAVGLERRLRDAAETARDVARRERDQAQTDRGIAERDRDSIEEYAAALQRTLLPPSLPHIDGLAVASYFRPISSRQVGGDFYDLFGLGGNRWAYFIGDVLGHGVDAAVVTSLIRHTLRSAALHYDDPTAGLHELNAVLLREVEPRRFCTVHFGTVQRADDGDGFEVTIATGGHQPALLVDPASGLVESVRPPDGMLVGALPDAVFDVCTVTVRPGQSLLFYTDGLVEARLDDDPFDEAALTRFVAARAGAGLTAMMDEIATLAPKLDQRDDIAMLAFEVTEEHTS
ncbi:SpoIIE family protein phosphatase [Mycobacterium sp. 236(2023)]|uniref:PP2C family protein-serine/threonine phosphatase n=1 Tax=Mycobacterium sp. 236(2023) TaxID=3038163 RepID=UPI0024156A53|nr:SpoIIE family protein phosphatase [Mycobacterium sp. 236(2023)]MDG4667521.1 SpoIIE family protein phosphatase [Mycobacterium sp. 236(2023)]